MESYRIPALISEGYEGEFSPGFDVVENERRLQIIDLKIKSASKKRRELTDAEREEIVVEFRLKGRKLARSILRKWQARLDFQEVDSIVDLSLCEAVRRYNPRMGASFMTFLYYHLRGNLIRAVSTAANVNAIPVADYEAAEAAVVGGRYRGANAVEVAEALSSHDGVLPDELVFKRQLVTLSAQALAKLDELEREVIERIYLKEEQLLDIANTLGYSRCHISRVKKKALETLGNELERLLEEEVGTTLRRGTKMLKRAAERRKTHRRRPRSKRAIRRAERFVDDKAVAVG